MRTNEWRMWTCVAGAVALAACSAGTTSSAHHGSREAPAPRSSTIDAGSAPTIDAGGAASSPSADACDNGLDDDGNGLVDDGCQCTPGTTQSCYPGAPADLGAGACARGVQTCEGAGEFGAWGACGGAITPTAEVCGDGVDQDCNGVVDDGCAPAPPPPTTIVVALSIDGDCVTASCPPEAPYPVGCMITMEGGDSRGCVASSPTSSEVYFQEGDRCGAGHVGGTLTCSTVPGSGLDASNCTINKPEPMYPSSPDGCPDTSIFGLPF